MAVSDKIGLTEFNTSLSVMLLGVIFLVDEELSLAVFFSADELQYEAVFELLGVRVLAEGEILLTTLCSVAGVGNNSLEMLDLFFPLACKQKTRK